MSEKIDLWKTIKPFQHHIDFKVLQEKIIALKNLVEQGIANQQVTDSMRNNDLSIRATFKGLEKDHNLEIIGIKVDEIRSEETGLHHIEVKDVMIDGDSLKQNLDKVIGLVL